MKPYRALIVEDEPLARDQLRIYLNEIPEIELVGECEDGFEGIRAIRSLNPDLVFLDIQMPRITGFEMLEMLDPLPQVIFSTAYDEFAVRAFELNAVDYLLKPYSKARFESAIRKALDRLNRESPGSANSDLRALVEKGVQARFPLQRIMVPDRTGFVLLETADILYVEAADDYVVFHTLQKKHLSQRTLSWCETAFGPGFARVHRSFLLNLEHLARLEPYGKETWMASLKNHPAKIPISRSGHKVLMETLRGQ